MNARYQEYLNSDDWQHLRLKKQKSARKCFVCGSIPKILNVHHVRYRNLTDVSTRDLRIACEDCHRLFHTVKDANPKAPEKYCIKQARKLSRAANQSNSNFHSSPPPGTPQQANPLHRGVVARSTIEIALRLAAIAKTRNTPAPERSWNPPSPLLVEGAPAP